MNNIRAFRRVNMASDPEVNLIDRKSGDLFPATIALEEYFSILGIEPESKFNIKDMVYKRTTRDTKVGPVHYLLGSNMDQVHPGASLVVDGTALEINSVPVTCRKHMQMSMAVAMNSIDEILKTLNNNGYDLRVTVEPTIKLSEEVLKNLPTQAAVFGCDADLDIYGEATNNIPDAKEHPYRYAGGHLHMSFGYAKGMPSGFIQAYTNEIFNTLESRLEWFQEHRYELTTLYDRTVGLATTAINKSVGESLRRKVYGQAGRIRVQPYGGIEYRTPSSSWLLDPTVLHFVTFWAQFANNLVFRPELKEAVEAVTPLNEVVRAINTGDSDTCLTLLKEVGRVAKGQDYIFADQYSVEGGIKLMSNICSYAEKVHAAGGVSKIFSDDTVASRWNRAGFAPEYGHLPTVDGFVFSN